MNLPSVILRIESNSSSLLGMPDVVGGVVRDGNEGRLQSGEMFVLKEGKGERRGEEVIAAGVTLEMVRSHYEGKYCK